MKKLQIDFTTKSQSRQLLNCGIPAWTANFYYDDENEIQIIEDGNEEFVLQRGYCPCWSACRLMEVYSICVVGDTDHQWQWPTFSSVMEVVDSYIEHIINRFAYCEFDFSKLEE